jgi:TolA-binding protein
MKTIYFLISYVIFITNVYGFSDQELVISLESLGEWEEAYRYANDSALKTNNYELWRYIASKPEYLPIEEKRHHQSYWKAWHFVSKINTQEAYEDFILIRPTLQANLLAVAAIFELVKKQNTPQAYLDFIDKFPNTIEAIDALLQLQHLAFEDAKQKNTITSYQKFLSAFPEATQTKEATDLLKTIFKKEVDDKLATLKTTSEIEDYARELYTTALTFEKNSNSILIASCHYDVLTELMPFRKTETLIELYKRKELLNFQNLLLAKLDDIKKGQEELKTALVEAIREQGREIKGEIKELSELTKQHHEQMKSQLQQISDGLEKEGSIIGGLSVMNTLVSTSANLWGMTNLIPTQKVNAPHIPINITTAHKSPLNPHWRIITTGVCSVLTNKVVNTGMLFIPAGATVAGISRLACKLLPIASVYFLS